MQSIQHATSRENQKPVPFVFLLSVWCGLLGSVIEVGILAIRKYYFHEILFLSPHFVWMIPVTYCFLFAISGLILFPLTHTWPTIISRRISVFVIAVLGFLGPLFAVPRLHKYAVLLVAVGLGVQTARFITARGDGFQRVVERTTWWMVAVVVGLAFGVSGMQMLAEGSAQAKLGGVSADAPNVVLLSLDTVRAKSLSVYGYSRATTPHLKRVAKSGVIFERAISTSPWTLPAHGSMFTGRWPHELSSDWKKPLDDSYPTLAEVLRSQGYMTAGFVANLIYCSSIHGLNRGFVHYDDFPVSLGQIMLSSSLGKMIATNDKLRFMFDYHRVLNRKTAEELTHDFLGWLSKNDHRPFFAFLNYFDAHEPYLPPEGFATQFGPRRKRVKFWHSGIDAFRPAKWEMAPQEVQAELDAYEGSIAYIDHYIAESDTIEAT